MQCTPVTVGRGRGRSRRWGRHGQRSGGGTNEGRGDGNTKAVDGIFPAKGCFTCDKKGQRVADYAEKLCRRCNGWGHAADVCSTAKEETVLAAESKGGSRDGGGVHGTAQGSAFKAREAGECYNAVRGMEDGE